jgi:16S rRNA (guanine527-N7)-methyltransferase
VDNASFADQIQQGCKALGVTVGEDVPPRLHRLMGELLKWNAKVNLTAITAEGEVVEKHFLDSLGGLRGVEGGGWVRAGGAGAGFPGLPLKMARPSLAVTMVDAVGKKVGYLKAVVVVPGLGLGGTKAVHTRAEGQPEAEGLPRADRVIARAFMDLPDWLDLAPAYLAPGGHVVAMLGKAVGEDELRAQAGKRNLKVVSARAYRLPFSGAERQVASFAKAE